MIDMKQVLFFLLDIAYYREWTSIQKMFMEFCN